MSENRTLARKRGIRTGVRRRRKGGLHSEGRRVPGRASKKNLLWRSRSKNERVSGRKSSLGGSGGPWFYFTKPEIGKEFGKRRARP